MSSSLSANGGIIGAKPAMMVAFGSLIDSPRNASSTVIPVILPDAPDKPEIPLFVKQNLWVNMRDWKSDGNDAFYQLVCGILGRAPGDSPGRKLTPRQVLEWQED